MIDLKKDYKDYLALLSLFSFGLAAFVYFGYDCFLQTVIIILVAFLYVVWGVIHHLSNEDFHLRVLLEYLAMAVFAVALILTLLKRA